MIPLRDNIPSRTTPLVTYLIIGACTLAFLLQLAAGERGSQIVEQYGMIPARLTHPEAQLIVRRQVAVQTQFGVESKVIEHQVAPPVIPAWLTVVTCMFLHGGWMHFLGNMWFLYVFGDNVEDRLGHIGYLLMYLCTGIIAALAHYITDDASMVPTIGASGAIAGVMGAYAWLYPHARVQALLPLIVIMQLIIVPAPIFLGLWFAIQTFSGISASAGGQAGGVAWWAHIGGFAAGILIALAVGRAHLGSDAVQERKF
ncbi:MAG: rhomboid family intramembrane serine protease [Rubripirellula sp.]